jgi:predicted secreted protein
MLLLFVETAALAMAQAATPSAATPAKPAKDPNEIVCEKQEQLGSRLSVKKVCMTRAEWAERRLQDRQAIDKAQTMRGTKGE